MATNAKHIGMNIAKSGRKGLTNLLSKAHKGLVKAGRDVIDLVDEEEEDGASSQAGGAPGSSGFSAGPLSSAGSRKQLTLEEEVSFVIHVNYNNHIGCLGSTSFSGLRCCRLARGGR